MIDSLWGKWNRVLAGIVLAFSFLIYFMTMSPTVSFWDCGEFIATSYTLGVPHPPGSPLYLIIGRIFSMLPFNNDIAYRVNMISPIVSAVAVMLLYLIIVKFAAHWRGGINSKSDAVIAFGGALVGSLTFAFTDSHWFNAVEAEVYSMSTFFTAIVVWLILKWAEKSDEPGSERFILIISYILGLATGIHLLNLLAVPFMGMIVYFKYREFSWKSFFMLMGIVASIFFTIYLAIIKGLPKLALNIGINGLVIVILLVVAGTVFVILRKYRLPTIILSSLVLILVGYSTYMILFIRSNQDPAIDENDPETVRGAIRYLEREQYGSVGVFPRRYNKIPAKHEVAGLPKKGREYSTRQSFQYATYSMDKQLKFFWNYQVRKMYMRYFLWQFAGRGPADESRVTRMGASLKRNEDGVDWFQFGLPLPLLLGLFGAFHHFRRDWPHGFSVFALFFLTGLAILIYLNQDNPQPRERDYSYVGSFFAFSIWIGIGAAYILEKVTDFFRERDFGNQAATITAFIMLIIMPVVLLSTNYREHDRSGNFVAWDYSYNMLQTCEPNGIIFTNGDNDTFPLWYLQEVEGIRKDVAVANLSLLNTPWYIKQLKNMRPEGERFIGFTDDQIAGKKPIGVNPATRQPLKLEVSAWKKQKVKVPVSGDDLNSDNEIGWSMKPTFGNQAIRVQDLMVYHIIKESDWKIPVYFAVTVSPSNRIGVDKYLQMEGLAFKLVPHEAPLVDYDKLDENLNNQYQFRNLDNPDVYYNPNIIKLLQNYRSAYLQLAQENFEKYLKLNQRKNKDEAELDILKNKVIENLRMMNTNIPYDIIEFTADEMYIHVGQIYHEIGAVEQSLSMYEAYYDKKPNDPTAIGLLLDRYREFERWDDAVKKLDEWIQNNPSDGGAARLREEFDSLRSAPAKS